MPFLVGTFLAVVLFASSQAALLTNAVTTVFKKSSALQLASFSITPPAPPQLHSATSACSSGQAINTVTWDSNDSQTYVLFRDATMVFRGTDTSFRDDGTDLPAGQFDAIKNICYVVRGVKADRDPQIGNVLSGNSNTICVTTPDCSGFASGGTTPTPLPGSGGTTTVTPTLPPGVATPTPSTVITPTKAGTPTPTKKVTPTPTSLPASCQSSTKMPDGRIVVSVKSFGNDIQKAIDCFKNTTGGGAVYIPAGTYTISKKISVFSNVIVFGDGIDSTILAMTGNDSAIGNDSSRGQSNIVIRDMTLRGPGNRGGTCCHGLKFENITGGYIINVAADNWGLDGIYLGYKSVSGLLKGVTSVRITGCRANNNDRNGIGFTQGTGVVIDNCSLTGNNIDPAKRASAIDLEPDSGGSTSNNFILDNTLTGNKGNGIGLGPNPNEPSPQGAVSGNAVCNNTTSNNDFAGIHGYKGNIFVNNNLQSNDGFEQADCAGQCASGPASACSIPGGLNTLPAVPPKPSVLGAATYESPSPTVGDIFRDILSLFTHLF